MRPFALFAVLAAIAGCAPIGGAIAPDAPKGDPLDLAAADAPSTSTKLAPTDLAVLASMHDHALVGCLYARNRQATELMLSSLGVNGGDLAAAGLAPGLAALGASKGLVATAAGLSSLFGGQIKGAIGLPQTSTNFASVAAGMDYFFNTFAASPGIAAQMADPSRRPKAIRRFRVALEQVCVSTFTFPTTNGAYRTSSPMVVLAPAQ
jgi:hypothetical protein